MQEDGKEVIPVFGQSLEFRLQFLKNTQISSFQVPVNIPWNSLQHKIMSVSYIPHEQADMLSQLWSEVNDWRFL